MCFTLNGGTPKTPQNEENPWLLGITIFKKPPYTLNNQGSFHCSGHFPIFLAPNSYQQIGFPWWFGASDGLGFNLEVPLQGGPRMQL